MLAICTMHATLIDRPELDTSLPPTSSPRPFLYMTMNCFGGLPVSAWCVAAIGGAALLLPFTVMVICTGVSII